MSDERGFVLDRPDQIKAFQLLQWRAAIKLEAMGLKHSRGSVTAHVKQHFKLKGNRDKVLAFLEVQIANLKNDSNLNP